MTCAIYKESLQRVNHYTMKAYAFLGTLNNPDEFVTEFTDEYLERFVTVLGADYVNG